MIENKKFLKIIKTISYKSAVYISNRACAYIYGQAKEPKELKKLRKF